MCPTIIPSCVIAQDGVLEGRLAPHILPGVKRGSTCMKLQVGVTKEWFPEQILRKQLPEGRDRSSKEGMEERKSGDKSCVRSYKSTNL